MRKICICNQKGGVGKTTTAYNLALELAKSHRVLLIDIDPQRNLSDMFVESIGMSGVVEVLFTGKNINDVVIDTSVNNVSLLCGDKLLSTADTRLTSVGREYLLREQLAKVQDRYDYVIIDTPPALSILTTNALVASDGIIVMAQSDTFSVYGIASFNNSVQAIRKYCNPDLKIIGILITRYVPRLAVNKNVMQLFNQIASGIGAPIFKTFIRECSVVKEACVARKGICEYKPNSIAAWDYGNFFEEIKNVL